MPRVLVIGFGSDPVGFIPFGEKNSVTSKPASSISTLKSLVTTTVEGTVNPPGVQTIEKTKFLNIIEELSLINTELCLKKESAVYLL